jgi:hypothetical protein
MAITLAQVITGIRELSFDRFSTPVLFIKKPGSGYTMTINSTGLIIKTSLGVTVESFLFSTYTTLKALSDALVASAQSYHVSYNAYFTADAETTMLLAVTNRDISLDQQPIYKKYYYTDNEIMGFIREYYAYILGYPCADLSTLDLETDVASLNCPRPHHMTVWCAYWAVDKRRLSELASIYLDQSAFSQSGDGGQISSANAGASMNVQIGDVFSLSEEGTQQYNEGEQPWRVGADNVLGDAHTFWYKVSLWLRKKLEDLFSDYSLRSSNVLQSHMKLEKDTNFYAYFDSFPWTISPYSRDILQGGNILSR